MIDFLKETKAGGWIYFSPIYAKARKHKMFRALSDMINYEIKKRTGGSKKQVRFAGNSKAGKDENSSNDPDSEGDISAPAVRLTNGRVFIRDQTASCWYNATSDKDLEPIIEALLKI